MQTITVHVEQSAAIARGSAQWGDRPIDLEAVLAELSAEERGQVGVSPDGHLLARRSNSYARISQRALVSDSTDTADVVAAIRTSIATIAEVREARGAEAREAVAMYLAGGECPRDYGASADEELDRLDLLVPVQLERDRRAEIWRADLRAWVVLVITAIDADEQQPDRTPGGKEVSGDRTRRATEAGLGDEYQVALERRVARRQAVATAREEARLAWAREYGSEDLCRAIDEGYPVGKRPRTEVTEWARGLLASVEGVTVLSTGCETEERTVPSSDSYAARDRVVAHAGGLELPDDCEIEVSRIMRITYSEYVDCTSEYHDDAETCSECDDDGEIFVERKRTGVVVTVRLPWGDEVLTIAFAE